MGHLADIWGVSGQAGALGSGLRGHVPATARRARRLRHVRHLALSLLHAVDRRLTVAMAALFAVLIASTVVLRLTYQLTTTRHLSVLDAAYFTVETITTVGYGDFSFRGQAPWLMASAICLMLAGALFVAVFFALLTNALVSRRISESLGRQRITGLTGHILVIGLGSVGVQVVQQLTAAGRDIVVLEKNEHNRHLGQIRALGVPVVIADATMPVVLESVRLTSASAVAVVTSDDLANRVHPGPLDRGAGRTVVRRRRARPRRAQHVLCGRRAAAGGPADHYPPGQAPGGPPPGRPLALASESRPDHQSARQPEDPDESGLEALPCWRRKGCPAHGVQPDVARAWSAS
jgi:voltage-gated potassium channel Kch